MDELRELQRENLRLTKERDAAVKENKDLNRTIQNMAQPPLLVAKVKRVVSKSFAIVITTNGQEFLVPYPNLDLHRGNAVVLNQNTLAIVKILPPDDSGDGESQPIGEWQLLQQIFKDIKNILQEIRDTLGFLRANPAGG